jgi:hypothetical protein
MTRSWETSLQTTPVPSFDLSNRNLYKKTESELKRAFSPMPTGEIALNLSNNHIGLLVNQGLAPLLETKSIATKIIAFNLQDNRLGLCPGKELRQLLAAAPYARSMNLSNNFLHRKNGTQLGKMAKILPPIH